MRVGLFQIKSWLPGVENERKRTSERKTASKQASERTGREKKEIDSERKRIRKGGRGGDTERRERRTRAEDSAARKRDSNE